MLEDQIKQAAADHSKLREVVRDVETQVEGLSRALETLRGRVVRLSLLADGLAALSADSAAAKLETPAPPAPQDEPAVELVKHEEPAAPLKQDWFSTNENTSWPSPATERSSTEPGSWESFFTHDRQQPAVERGPAEQPIAAKEPAADEALSTSSWSREETWSQDFSWPKPQETEDEDPSQNGAKEDVRSIVEQVRAELEAVPTDAINGVEEGPIGDDDEAKRAEVNRMVELMRAELAGPSEEPLEDNGLDGGSPNADEGKRAEVSRIVELMRAELTGSPDEPEYAGQGSRHDMSSEDDEARREEARRAVEAMRAELGGQDYPAATPSPEPAQEAHNGGFKDWTKMESEVGPAMLVLKDATGRVELAHVYELLSHVRCGDSASLLNYTPHSVTVGLAMNATIPTADELDSAVQDIFGRACSISRDGVRVSVDMGGDSKKRRGEGAA